MTNFFEALRRFEQERAGGNEHDDLQAADILRLAERRESLRWQKHGTGEESGRKEPRGISQAIHTVELERVPYESGKPVPAEVTKAGQLADLFSQIASHEWCISPQERLVCLSDPNGPAAEAFRLLGVRLRHLRQNRQLNTILITSSIPREGKSTIAANLTCVLARNKQQRVLLLEGDVRRPGLSKLFCLEQAPGLCELLSGNSTVAASTYYLPVANAWIMPAGKSDHNPLELLQSAKLNSLMSQLQESFDTILIDSAPFLPLADTSIWMRLADGILLVARAGTTAKRQLTRGLEILPTAKLIGAVLNGSNSSVYSDYYRSAAERT